MTKYAVECQSSTGWFTLEFMTTSHARAIKIAREFISDHAWDGIPRSAHRR